MMLNRRLSVLAVALLVCPFTIGANVATLRNHVAVEEEPKTPPMPKPVKDDVKVPRNYPMQPPLIPHNIRDYQVTAQVNTCLACHSRSSVGDSQATMVSVTHYMDRDGNFLATVSPRRYFCNQCHVPQNDLKPLVDNTFVDIKSLIKDSKSSSQ